MNQPLIHEATLEDLPRLTELLAVHHGVDSDCGRSKQISDGVRFLLEHPAQGFVFVAQKDGQVIGLISLIITISTAEGGLVLLVEDIVVARDCRNRGFGSMLLEHTARYAREKGFLRVTLLSQQCTETARRFFKKRGFADSEMIPMQLSIAP